MIRPVPVNSREDISKIVRKIIDNSDFLLDILRYQNNPRKMKIMEIMFNQYFCKNLNNPYWKLLTEIKLKKLNELFSCFEEFYSFDLLNSNYRNRNMNFLFFAFMDGKNNTEGGHVDLTKNKSNVIYLQSLFFKLLDEYDFEECYRIILHEGCHLSMDLVNDYFRDYNTHLMGDDTKPILSFYFEEFYHLNADNPINQRSGYFYEENVRQLLVAPEVKNDRKFGNADSWTYFILDTIRYCGRSNKIYM